MSLDNQVFLGTSEVFPRIEWDANILKKYNIAGPRYTSYPTALEFSEAYCKDEYLTSLNAIEEGQALSLYIHIPFCENICYYCACNKIISKNKQISERYVASLINEIELVSMQIRAKSLRQIHWGGGTPTFLSVQQIKQIMQTIRRCFDLETSENTEVSIEIDPRALALDDIKELAELGFNRMSFGVQDFDEKVQKAVNRIQSFELTNQMVAEAREHRFQSINLDLIYGLPLQTLASFEKTLEKVIKIAPDRISVFNYAHLPHRFKPQRRINAEALPGPIEKLLIFEYIIERLQTAGYVYIGMDHFAKPGDELAIAQQSGRLHRNFQGYTTHDEYQLIGVGVSAIGNLNGQYHQNVRDIEAYYQALENHELACWRGKGTTFDDRVRKAVIFALICQFELSKKEIELNFGIEFESYFKKEQQLLKPFEEDGLLVISKDRISVSLSGRLLIRNICMMFDAYLNEMPMTNNFSKAI